jgi:phosphohistidine phosphatase SixA
VDILLVRHAKSEHNPSLWRSDDVRRLSARGEERQKKAARGMLSAGLSFDEAWVSPYCRARQTLDLILDVYDPVPVVLRPELIVWEPAQAVMSLLQACYEQRPDARLLLVGHNPNMTDLLHLLGGYEYMRTSDLAWMRWDDDGPHQVKFFSRAELMKHG